MNVAGRAALMAWRPARGNPPAAQAGRCGVRYRLVSAPFLPARSTSRTWSRGDDGASVKLTHTDPMEEPIDDWATGLIRALD